MKKYLSSVLSLSVFLFLSASVSAVEPIIDANSISRLILKIDTLPSGGLINLTFKSEIDNTLQPMLVKVPKDYTKTKSWPLLVVLHGLGDGPIVVPSIDSMVQVGPFGRGDIWYHDVGEQDIFECIEIAKKIFNVDHDKIYLCGFSMGAAGTFDIGLKYPDIWAACVPVCGKMYNLDLVANGGNLPFWINAGSKDSVVPAKYSKRVYEKAIELGFNHWKYTEYDGMGHSFWIDWEEIEEWLLSQKRVISPFSISYTSERPTKTYWSEITEKFDKKSPAHIDVTAASQTIKVKVSNVADYTLYLKDSPIDFSQEVTIIENDNQIFRGQLSVSGIFNKKLNGKKPNKVDTK